MLEFTNTNNFFNLNKFENNNKICYADSRIMVIYIFINFIIRRKLTKTISIKFRQLTAF